MARFQITGPITFDTDPAIRDSVVYGAVIYLAAAAFCEVRDVVIKNTPGRAIGNYTYAANFENIKFMNLADRPNKSQYGYGIQDSGWMTRVSNCHGQNLRHLYSEGGGGCVTNSTQYELYGGGCYAHVSDCTAMNCQSQGFDTHGSAYSISFSNCVVYGTFQGASSGGLGFSARGRKIRFDNCIVDGATAGFSITAANTIVRNCVARRIDYLPVSVGGDTADAVRVLDVPGVRIIDCEFETTNGNTPMLLGSAPGYTCEVSIEDTTLRHLIPKSGSRLLEIAAGATVVLKDLTMDISQAPNAVPVSGMYVTDDGAVVKANNVSVLGGSSSVSGFSLVNYGTGGVNAAISMANVTYQHATLTPNISASFTNLRVSYIYTIGSSDNRSSALSLAAANSAVVPTANKLDNRVFVRLTGANGAVTLSAIPAGVNGQTITLINISNGDVTLPSLNTIHPSTFSSYTYLNNSWLVTG
jgi:hypothetical protein